MDVLSFEGKEQLSAPFRYDIQFTSSDKSIAPESGADAGRGIQPDRPAGARDTDADSLRTLYGVITGI